MKLVWKCNYCSETNVDKDKIETHEIKCVFNPVNRHCYTCDNRYNYYESELCKVHYNGWPSTTDNSEYYYSVMEKEIRCKDWVNLEIRSKKLKKLKDKINEN
jgi:hypothetical protein